MQSVANQSRLLVILLLYLYNKHNNYETWINAMYSSFIKYVVFYFKLNFGQMRESFFYTKQLCVVNFNVHRVLGYIIPQYIFFLFFCMGKSKLNK